MISISLRKRLKSKLNFSLKLINYKLKIFDTIDQIILIKKYNKLIHFGKNNHFIKLKFNSIMWI